MARLPYVNDDQLAEIPELVDRVRAERRGNLLNLYRMLLHSPTLAESWLGIVNAIRSSTQLDPRTREIAILRVAKVNNCEYELRQHVPNLARASGLTDDECEAILAWPHGAELSPHDACVADYADSVTTTLTAGDELLAQLKRHLNSREIVELTVIVGLYNMHGRLIEALGIDLEP